MLLSAYVVHAASGLLIIPTCGLVSRAGRLCEVMNHAGTVVPTAISVSQKVTAPGPAAAPSPSEDAI